VKPAILICGQTGTGKSSIVNFRLRKPAAKIGNNAESVRNGFPPPKYENDDVIFYDCDGYEIGTTDIYKNKLIGFLAKKNGKAGIHLVWYTINAAAQRVTDFDREIVGLISQYFFVFILLTKIDECNKDELDRFCGAVRDVIPETPIYRVSAIKGEIQKFTDWDVLVKSTTESLSTVLNGREIVQKLQKLTKKADSVIEKTLISAGLSAAIPVFLDSVVLITVLSRMVSKILAVYGLNLNKNTVKHVIKTVLPQVIGQTAVKLVSWIAGAVFGGVSNVKITKSLGKATIDLCNEYMSEELLKGKSKRNFESVFISDNLAQTFLLEYKKNES
jgi:uncharacterized protein (DUF697 family)/GTP-binding protein EngB required for normal cell division